MRRRQSADAGRDLFCALENFADGLADQFVDMTGGNLLLEKDVCDFDIRGRHVVRQAEGDALLGKRRLRVEGHGPIGICLGEKLVGIGCVDQNVGSLRGKGQPRLVIARKAHDGCAFHGCRDRLVLGRAGHDCDRDASLVDVGDRNCGRRDLRIVLIVGERDLIFHRRDRELDRHGAGRRAVQRQRDVPFSGLKTGNDIVPGRIDKLRLHLENIGEFLAEIGKEARIFARCRVAHDVGRSNRRTASQDTGLLHALPIAIGGLSIGAGCGNACHKGERGQRPQGGRDQLRKHRHSSFAVREARFHSSALAVSFQFSVGCVSTDKFMSTPCRQSQAKKLHCRHAVFLAQCHMCE
ncbi:hypothetical protein RHSP_30642 [Rhizobium freirei PRF 81]|uniref:Uncharacterized protein n=1 Tax=Rhizobium freirei PRF 81 TaxID=363754 RepID=N6U942_9HYPH|nr:hypothetical protein RHSP_30642 [Rhizobium freirei PRF 81]